MRQRSRRFRLERLMTISALRVFVFLVRKLHLEIGNKPAPLHRCQKSLAKTRERVTSSVVRGCFHMAVGADPRNRAFARKELLAVTA